MQPFTRRQLGLALPFAQKLTAAEPVLASFPAQPADLVRETVTVAHGNFKRLKELVDARPALANAAIDWGFGDWEDALGAASHVGHRQIAEYLIAQGARPTLFSAAMLGQLETVKALLAAHPGAQRIAGPHSISLLAHAKAGDAQADGVYQYLLALGDAGSPTQPPVPDAATLTGVYSFGPGATDAIEITEKDGQLSFRRKGADTRRLFNLGNHAFHPAGASAVRIRFTGASESKVLTVEDPALVLTARRTSA